MNSLQTAPPVSHAAEGLLRLEHPATGELGAALRAIADDFPGRFTDGPEGLAVAFRRLPPGRETARIEAGADRLTIHYTTPACAFRALATIMSDAAANRLTESSSSAAYFPSRGAMIDASRNGVPHLEMLRYLVRRLALMGFNRLLMYCEDTIAVPGEPLVGYFRGGYSAEDLRELDDYAASFGIEVVPAIQTLGHLEQVLQWPKYWPLRDTPRVLLASEPAVYEFIEKLIAAATAPFRSKRIHIGLDEAHGVGSGVYQQRHGPTRPFEVLTSHLAAVAEICERRGLDPMIWSDMFFRLGSPKNHYYDRESSVPDGTKKQIPPGVDLVYWDYYHRDEDFYDEWIARHRALGEVPVFATGVWTWNRFWAELPHSLATIAPGMAAARRGGVSEVFATLWGDDGTECDLLSALPGLEFFAGECFEGGRELVAEQFRGSCDADWEAWCSVSAMDVAEGHTGRDGDADNLAKMVLWQDPLLGFLEKHMPAGLSARYAAQQTTFEAAAALPGNNRRLAHPARLAGALSLKARLHEVLRPAYQQRDHVALRNLADHLIPALQHALDAVHESHRALWQELYQPYGWDVVDRRYGGLRARLDSLALSLELHLETGQSIPELALKPQLVASPAAWPDFIVTHARAASASFIA